MLESKKKEKVVMTEVEHKCNKEVEIAEMHTMIKDLHHIIKGNGKPGLWAEFNQAKCGLSVFKFIAGSSFLAVVVSLVLQFV